MVIETLVVPVAVSSSLIQNFIIAASNPYIISTVPDLSCNLVFVHLLVGILQLALAGQRRFESEIQGKQARSASECVLT